MFFHTVPRALASKWEGRLGLLVPLHKGRAYLFTVLWTGLPGMMSFEKKNFVT